MSVFAAAQRGSASIRGLTSTFRSISLSSTATPAFSSRTVAPVACRAAFSTTPAQNANESTRHKLTVPMSKLPKQGMPAYPYGPRLIYKQSNKGLHGNLRPRVGCNVSEDHKVRTPRTWRPNIHRKRLWSDALNCFIRTRVSIRVLRTIRKEGGLDNYIMGIKTARMKELGPAGWHLRYLLMRTEAIQNKHEAECRRLGVVDESFYESLDPAVVAKMEALVSPVGVSGQTGMSAMEKRTMELAAAQIGTEMAAGTFSGEFDLSEEVEEKRPSRGGKGGKAKRP